ncbi:hypothetical protein NP493_40g04027 [Ridgeia piscesae]|uniref:Uncharacterized protein n=1 Tax=Ridgeia piscesae TaxID=27915 RepID=A0AAD9PC84_RIDPI|nr:hypothetical protein NP493_40g04027 [Ridgeia piscesae]
MSPVLSGTMGQNAGSCAFFLSR